MSKNNTETSIHTPPANICVGVFTLKKYISLFSFFFKQQPFWAKSPQFTQKTKLSKYVYPCTMVSYHRKLYLQTITNTQAFMPNPERWRENTHSQVMWMHVTNHTVLSNAIASADKTWDLDLFVKFLQQEQILNNNMHKKPDLINTEDVPLVEFMYLVFTCMPGESYRTRLRSLLYLCFEH